MENIPFVAYESVQVRHERTVKRLIIALVISAILLFASNIIWICIFNSYTEGDIINSNGYNEQIESAFFSKKEYSRVFNDLCYTFNEKDFISDLDNIFISDEELLHLFAAD